MVSVGWLSVGYFCPNQGNKQFAFCFFAAFGMADQFNKLMFFSVLTGVCSNFASGARIALLLKCLECSTLIHY